MDLREDLRSKSCKAFVKAKKVSRDKPLFSLIPLMLAAVEASPPSPHIEPKAGRDKRCGGSVFALSVVVLARLSQNATLMLCCGCEE